MKRRRPPRIVLIGLGPLLAIAGAGFLGLLLFIGPLPPLALEEQTAPSSLVLDRSGRLLYEIIDPQTGSQRPVPLEEMPVALRQAVIATEDSSFYTNPGLDLRGIVRALLLNLRSGEIRAGGSTITQQVARTLLLADDERYERTLRRKAREAVLAWRLTRALPKDDILALYLNNVYYGNLAYGAEAAARAYFGKPVSQLGLAECAMLAGLPQAPAQYNPLTNLANAKERQNTVLRRMVECGYISRERAEQAYREPLYFASEPFPVEAPHFCFYAVQEVEELLGAEALARGGLRIYTTLDLDAERAAEAHLARHLLQLNRADEEGPGHNVHNGAVVVLEPQTGAVRVMIGSPDYFDSAICGAVNAALSLRQPGSAIKPFTYAAAFERSWSPASLILDVPTSFQTGEGEPYTPQNYDRRFHGPVPLRTALACSYNVSTVRLLDSIGVESLLEMAARAGVRTLDNAGRYGLALTLGGGEVRLLDLTAAYGVLASGGYRVTPYAVERVEALNGQTLYQHEPIRQARVLDERVAYLVTDVLRDPQARMPAFGALGSLYTTYGAAVKTGTTTEWRDNWTIGYTVDYVTGVWVGNADNSPMERVSGVSGAAPIWQAVMDDLHAHRVISPFPEPEGLARVVVCAESGALPGPACSHRREELFLVENIPMSTCEMHRLVQVDALTGRLAGEETPVERRILRAAMYWPAEAIQWAKEEGLPLPPEGSLAPTPAEATAAAIGDVVAAAPFLASPPNNATYCLTEQLDSAWQRVEVRAVVLGNPQSVALWVDGQRSCTWNEPPYADFWPLSPGEHEMYLVVTDAQGETRSGTPVHITVLPNCHEERKYP